MNNSFKGHWLQISACTKSSRLEGLEPHARKYFVCNVGTVRCAVYMSRMRLRLLHGRLGVVNHHSCPCQLLQQISVSHQCCIRSLRIRSRTSLFFPRQTLLVSVCEPLLPPHACHQAVGPNLATTPRVRYTCRCAYTAGSQLSFGPDGVQTTCANTARDHLLFSGVRVIVARQLPALASPRWSRVLSPFSSETCGSRLTRGTELFLPARRSRLRTPFPGCCLYSVNPSSKMVYRVRPQPQCRTPHGTRGELGLSVVSLPFLHRRHPCVQQIMPQVVRALNKAFGLGIITWLARHGRFPCLACFTAAINACIAGSPSAPCTVLFRLHASSQLLMLLTVASAGPFRCGPSCLCRLFLSKREHHQHVVSKF